MKNCHLYLFLLFFIQCENHENQQQNNTTTYTCSMHPQIQQPKPGTCPICFMNLTPVTNTDQEENNTISLSKEQILLGNIKTEILTQKKTEAEIILPAILAFDQMKILSINARTNGRIEKLYWKTLGDHIHKNTPLYDMYSEAINNVKQEYILALQKKKIPESEFVKDIESILSSTKNKMILWGITENQIQDLHKQNTPHNTFINTTFYSSYEGYITQLNKQEGNYVKEGETILELTDLSTLWAEAQVAASRMLSLEKYPNVYVEIPQLHNLQIQGTISFFNPEINPNTRIYILRISIPNHKNLLTPGMQASIKLKSNPIDIMTIPTNAILKNENYTSVWIQIAPQKFKNILITTGNIHGNRTEILSGLQYGDILVISGAYSLYSEYTFKKGEQSLHIH
ncbi:MAG: efflux RND transporter periplasmic adaptor subunit [Chitinophagaceae bacterium]|nr:efflux RND transporter periplasmic adaptor subunit [Chitinophagaceae bacterium]